MVPALMTAFKHAVSLALFLCVLLPLTMAQDDDSWFWIMADSKNSTTTCPGRCLAVNDSGAMDYNDRPVIFVACKVDSTSDSTTANNKNQRWIRDANANTTIRFNASAASEDPQAGILCLQAIQNPNLNQALKLSTCTGRLNQQWIVANDSIKTLAFNPPYSLAMAYALAGFVNSSNVPLGYRRATILRTPNTSFTTTFSMIDGTLEAPPPQPTLNNETVNFILNGGFEQTSYDFPNSTAALPVTTSDPFILCNWQVMKDSATLRPNPSPIPETNRSLLLKDGVVRQIIATSPGAFYTLILNVATAAPDASDSSNQCSGNDTLSVNPYPSSNLHQDLQILNRSWTKQHLSFQAVGSTMQLAFQGCTTCGCYLSDLNLIQVLGSSPFPPPPPRPSPPTGPDPGNKTEDPKPNWPDFSGSNRFGGSKRLSNGAVVGIVVATAALFFGIGGACFWVLVGKKRDLRKENEISVGRPGEWSIQTTTPAQSLARTRGNSSTAVPQTTPPSAMAVSASSLQTVPTSNPMSSSSDPRDERGV